MSAVQSGGVQTDVVQIKTTNLRGECSKLPRLVARHEITLVDGIDNRFPAGAQLVEWVDNDGNRRFRPEVMGDRSCVRESVLYLATMGELILKHRGQPIEKPGFQVNVLRFFFQQSERIQGRYRRDFRHRKDLLVPDVVQNFVESESVLPESLGREDAPSGRQWTVSTLLDRGHSEAQARGTKSPTVEDRIKFGLLARALETPFDLGHLTEEEIESVIRTGVFDLGTAGRPDQSTTCEVLDRLYEAIEDHDHVDLETFQKWFFDDVPNIVKQVAQRTTGPGRIDRQIVRQVHLELLFEAFQFTGKCFSAAMEEVASQLDAGWTDTERDHFWRLFVGGWGTSVIPLILLRDRLVLFGLDPLTAEIELFSEGVVLRLLSYYGEMNRNRREADRELKRLKSKTGPSGNIVTHHELNSSNEPENRVSTSLTIRELAALSRERHGTVCECGNSDRWDVGVAESGEGFVFTHSCRVCDTVVETPVDTTELQQSFATDGGVLRRA